MIEARYKYALIDMSYLMYRNAFANSKGKGIGEYIPGDVVRTTIQTINKISRDYGITADKFIFLYDKWDSELEGYYRTAILKGLYKDDRVNNYITREQVDAMKQDPNITPEQLKKAEEKCYFNEVCKESKKIMIKELKNFGLPSVGIPGWEADDLIWLSSGMLYDDSGDPNIKSNIIITKDSDILYSLTPQMDYFKIPTGGSIPKIITYDEMYQSIPDVLKGKISLHDYGSYVESLGDGHNNMRKTKKRGANTTNAILHILDGDMSDIADIEKFKRNLKTFDISCFPKFEEARETILGLYSTIGRIGTVAEFRDFCNKYKIEGISDRYFTDLVSRFDQRLFNE